jgi:hypothetical protein
LSIALSPILSKKDFDPYLISYLVLSTINVVVAVFAVVARSKVTGFVIPFIVKSAVTV